MKKQYYIILFFSLLTLLFSEENFPSFLNFSPKIRQRVLLTTSCKDCDYIPKVPLAGECIEENGSHFQIMHNGLKVFKDGYCGGWMTEIIRQLKGHHEPQEEKAFYEVLKVLPSNATMIELGCNWSYYSMWFKHTLPQATNYMIEPFPNGINAGIKNFHANQLNGYFYQGIIQKSRFFSKARLINKIQDASKSPPNISIDEFIQDHKLSFVHLLHSDIQGAEFEMLKNCIHAIQNKIIGFFFISTHSEDVHKKCMQFLKKMNYYIIIEHTPAESCSYDGLIVASSIFYPELSDISISKY